MHKPPDPNITTTEFDPNLNNKVMHNSDLRSVTLQSSLDLRLWTMNVNAATAALQLHVTHIPVLWLICNAVPTVAVEPMFFQGRKRSNFRNL